VPPSEAGAQGAAAGGASAAWDEMLRSDTHQLEGARAACLCLLPAQPAAPPAPLPPPPPCAPLPRTLQEGLLLALHREYPQAG